MGGYRKNYMWRNITPPEYYNGNGMRQEAGIPALGSPTSQTFLVDNKYAIPVVLPAGSSYDRVAIRGASGSGSGVARLGLYANDPTTNRPGKLMKDWGTVTQADAERNITIDLNIHKTDVYWLVMQLETANYLARWHRSFGLMPLVTTAYEGIASCLQQSGTTAGSLSNPWGTSIGVADKAPQIFLRCNKVASDNVATKSVGATALDGIVGQQYNCVGSDYANGSVSNDVAAVAETLYHMPFYLARGTKIGKIIAAIQTGASAGKGGWFCIYSADLEGRPAKRMWVSSKVVMDTGGGTEVSATVNRYFPAGHYYMGVKTEASSTPTFDGISSRGGYFSAIDISNWPTGTFSVADVTGNPPPATFPTGTVSEIKQSIIIKGLSFVTVATGSQDRDLHYSHTQNRTIIPYHHFRKGWWIGPHGMEFNFPGSPTKTVLSNSNTNLCPLFVHRTTLFDEISIDLTTVGTAGNIQFGLYSSTFHGAPHKLMRVFGTASATGSAGIRSVSINPPIKLEPGLYWKAVGAVGTTGNPDTHSHEVQDAGKAVNEGAADASHVTLGSSFPVSPAFLVSFVARGAAVHMKVAGFG